MRWNFEPMLPIFLRSRALQFGYAPWNDYYSKVRCANIYGLPGLIDECRRNFYFSALTQPHTLVLPSRYAPPLFSLSLGSKALCHILSSVVELFKQGLHKNWYLLRHRFLAIPMGTLERVFVHQTKPHTKLSNQLKPLNRIKSLGHLWPGRTGHPHSTQYLDLANNWSLLCTVCL